MPEEHWCRVCGKHAMYGFGIKGNYRPKPGQIQWFCEEHRKEGKTV
jgi:hypothetical protein